MKKNVNLEAQDEEGETPIFASLVNPITLTYLLDNGANMYHKKRMVIHHS